MRVLEVRPGQGLLRQVVVEDGQFIERYTVVDADVIEATRVPTDADVEAALGVLGVLDDEDYEQLLDDLERDKPIAATSPGESAMGEPD